MVAVSNWNLVTVGGNTPTIDMSAVKVDVPGSIRVNSGYAISPYYPVSSSTEYTVNATGKTFDLVGSGIVYIIETTKADGGYLAEHSIVFNEGTIDWMQKGLTFTTLPGVDALYVVVKIEDGYGTFWAMSIDISSSGIPQTDQLKAYLTVSPLNVAPGGIISFSSTASGGVPTGDGYGHKVYDNGILIWDSGLGKGYTESGTSVMSKPGTHVITSEVIDGIHTISSSNSLTVNVSGTIPVTKKIMLGNWGRKVWGSGNDPDHTEIEIDNIVYSFPAWVRPGVMTVIQDYERDSGKVLGGATDINWVNARFRDLEEGGNWAMTRMFWTHASFLMCEELWTVVQRSNWNQGGNEDMKNWYLSGTFSKSIGGVLYEADLIQTYFTKKGTWSISVLSNSGMVMEWACYYQLALLKAWHAQCHSLGGKSAILGPVSIIDTATKKSGLRQIWDAFPTQELRDWVMNNIDLVLLYQYPASMAEVPVSPEVANAFRNTYGFKGHIAFLLTSIWPGAGTDDINVERSEFNAVAPYVDSIWVTSRNSATGSIQLIPRLIQFEKDYNPAPCIPNWQCEIPLNGYEKDGCGNRRTNPACNPCVPNWQCEIPLNGYEKDGCGNRRTNSACNPCIPNWQCETPLNGYEMDGCGNRRTNSACNPVPGCVPNWQCELPLNGYEMDGCGNRRMNLNCNPLSPEEIRKKLKELFPFLPQIQLPKGPFFAFRK